MNKIIFLIAFYSSLSCFAQNNNQKQIDIDKKIFKDLYDIRCEGIASFHNYINNLKIFHMVTDDENYMTSYKINGDYNFFISVYNDGQGGFRINSPNSFLYDFFISEGIFVEIHKEEKTSFLVYKFNDETFLLNSSIDSKGRKHFIVDFWCLKK